MNLKYTKNHENREAMGDGGLKAETYNSYK